MPGVKSGRYNLLYDRAELAAVKAVELETRLATGGAVVFRQDAPQAAPGVAMAAALARVEDLLTVALLAVCPHADPYAPVPLYWHGWHPDALLCAPCSLAASRSLAEGDGLESACDHCLAADPPTLAVHSWMRRPYIYDDRDRPEVMPPVVVRLRLCPACQTVDARPQEG